MPVQPARQARSVSKTEAAPPPLKKNQIAPISNTTTTTTMRANKTHAKPTMPSNISATHHHHHVIKSSKKPKKSTKRSKRTKLNDSDDRLSIAKKSLTPRGFSDVSHSYLNYGQIVQYLHFVKNKYSSFVQLHSLGYSCEHREIFALEIDFCCPKHISALRRRGSKMFYALGQRRDRCLDGSAATDCNYVFIEGGTHAREWITISVALHCIYQFTERAYRNIDVLRKLRFLIVPIVNPDGYEYSISNNCRWRKNRHVHNAKYVGTDCNRNYNFHWEQGVSRMGSPTYKGEAPFSEPETRALRNILVRLGDQILFLLSLHSYGQSLMYPWGYKHELPQDCADLQLMARAGQAAIKSHKGRIYRTGSIANTFKRTIPGSIVDYAYGELGIPLTLVMELPSKEYGFQPDTALISPICRESFFGIYQMCRCAIGVAGRTGLFYSELAHGKTQLKTHIPAMPNRARRELRKMCSSEAITHEESMARHAAAKKIPRSYNIVTLQKMPLTAEEKALTQLTSSASTSPSPSTNDATALHYYDSTSTTQSSTSTNTSSDNGNSSFDMRVMAAEAERQAVNSLASAAKRMTNVVINTLPWTDQFRGMPTKPQKAQKQPQTTATQQSPDAAETPELPETPRAPAVPQMPQTPQTPGKLKFPDSSEMPEMLALPKASKMPQRTQSTLAAPKPQPPPRTQSTIAAPKMNRKPSTLTAPKPQKPQATLATQKPQMTAKLPSPQKMQLPTPGSRFLTPAVQQELVQKARAQKALLREQLKEAEEEEMSKVNAKKISERMTPAKTDDREQELPPPPPPPTTYFKPPPQEQEPQDVADKETREKAQPQLEVSERIDTTTNAQIFTVATQNELLLFEQGLRQLLHMDTKCTVPQPTQALRHHRQQLYHHKQCNYQLQNMELAKRGKINTSETT